MKIVNKSSKSSCQISHKIKKARKFHVTKKRHFTSNDLINVLQNESETCLNSPYLLSRCAPQCDSIIDNLLLLKIETLRRASEKNAEILSSSQQSRAWDADDEN